MALKSIFNKTSFKFTIGFSAIIIVGLFALYLTTGIATKNRESKNPAFKMGGKETIMAYGGKTPEEALELFVSALEKEDVELASKYFLLEQDNWRARLNNVLKEGYLTEMAADLSKAKRQKDSSDGSAVFVVEDKSGQSPALINIAQNENGLWKIVNID